LREKKLLQEKLQKAEEKLQKAEEKLQKTGPLQEKLQEVEDKLQKTGADEKFAQEALQIEERKSEELSKDLKSMQDELDATKKRLKDLEFEQFAEAKAHDAAEDLSPELLSAPVSPAALASPMSPDSPLASASSAPMSPAASASVPAPASPSALSAPGSPAPPSEAEKSIGKTPTKASHRKESVQSSWEVFKKPIKACYVRIDKLAGKLKDVRHIRPAVDQRVDTIKASGAGRFDHAALKSVVEVVLIARQIVSSVPKIQNTRTFSDADHKELYYILATLNGVVQVKLLTVETKDGRLERYQLALSIMSALMLIFNICGVNKRHMEFVSQRISELPTYANRSHRELINKVLPELETARKTEATVLSYPMQYLRLSRMVWRLQHKTPVHDFHCHHVLIEATDNPKFDAPDMLREMAATVQFYGDKFLAADRQAEKHKSRADDVERSAKRLRK